jgi:hypothetical protein
MKRITRPAEAPILRAPPPARPLDRSQPLGALYQVAKRCPQCARDYIGPAFSPQLAGDPPRAQLCSPCAPSADLPALQPPPRGKRRPSLADLSAPQELSASTPFADSLLLPDDRLLSAGREPGED